MGDVFISLFNILLFLKLSLLSILIMLWGNVKINAVQRFLNRVFLFVTEILIIYLRIIFSKYFLKAYVPIHKFDYNLLIQKPFLTRVYLLAMTIWLLMGTTWYTVIIDRALNAEEFASIIKSPFVIN